MTAKPVVDATRPLRVRLQPGDAVGARRSDPSACVIARAIARRPGVVDQRVGAVTARIEYAKRTVRYVLDPNDVALEAGFDDGRDAFAAGYTVTLLPPPPHRQLGARSGERHGTDRRSGNHDGVVKRASHRRIDVIPETN